ncbi:MAG: hypothetical protein PHV30_05675 [Candidatus Margulisbacteria bacterium]|nr:hypothetical protein [Candidatus Margulisiibacteriota bacterium]
MNKIISCKKNNGFCYIGIAPELKKLLGDPSSALILPAVKKNPDFFPKWVRDYYLGSDSIN